MCSDVNDNDIDDDDKNKVTYNIGGTCKIQSFAIKWFLIPCVEKKGAQIGTYLSYLNISIYHDYKI